MASMETSGATSGSTSGGYLFRSVSKGMSGTLSRTQSVSGTVSRTQSVNDANSDEEKFLARMLDRTLSVSQTDRRDMHLQRLDSVSPPARTDTVLGHGPSQRDLLARNVSHGTNKVPINEGQTGSVFALELDESKIAVFKPEAGESFQRRGFQAGSGAVREEAVYIVDRLSGSTAGVPVTTLAEVMVEGESMRGAVQAFQSDAAGFCDDFGMPQSLSDATNIISCESAEQLALLDIRVFNTDRHGANLLFLGQRPPYKLGPIDHGCCLPPWWALSEAGFSAWEGWVQLQGVPSASARETARKAKEHLPRMCELLGDRGLDFEAIVTLRLCTTFAAVAVGEKGLPICKLAELMTREDFAELSWFEQKVLASSVRMGAKVSQQVNDRGDKELTLENGHELDEAWADAFVDHLEGVMRLELSGAGSDDDEDDMLERTLVHQQDKGAGSDDDDDEYTLQRT